MAKRKKCSVSVICGSQCCTGEYEGMSVKKVQAELLKVGWSLPEDAIAVLNAAPAGPNQKLASGDQLVLSAPFRSKGGAR